MTETRQEKTQRLARESYEVATAKGWHDSDELDENGMPTVRQLLQWCSLFHTEVTEYEQETAHWYLDGDKPCGKITELADVAIRVWDAIGRCGFSTRAEGYAPPKSIRHSIDAIIESARVRGVKQSHAGLLMLNVVDIVFADAKSIGYDADKFIWFIEQKIAHNRTRERRHGGKLA